MRRTDILERELEIRQWISEELPNAEIARRLSCKVDTLKSYYKKMGIEYAGNLNRKGMKHYELRVPAEQFVLGNAANSAKRKRLIEDGLKEEKCEVAFLNGLDSLSPLNYITLTSTITITVLIISRFYVPTVTCRYMDITII